jgi:hypothetical protein
VAAYQFSIDVPIINHWDNVELLRMSVQSCCAAVFRDVDGSHLLAMVTGELVENAIKYGAWSEERAFRLRLAGEDDRATITVENPVKAADPNVAQLLDTIRWIDSFPSRAEAYRERLLQIAKSPGKEDESGLGLVRVAYEADCVLSAEIDRSVLRVSAQLKL